jgi:hypothetical protein
MSEKGRYTDIDGFAALTAMAIRVRPFAPGLMKTLNFLAVFFEFMP